MAFEPVFDTAVFDSYRRLGTGQAVVEARLLPKPETRIAKVLSTSCQVAIGAAEAFTGEARYSGRVNFKVLFEDASGKPEALDYNADFSDKLLADGVSAATKTHFTAKVLDMDIVAVEEDVIKLAAVVEVTLYGCDRENVKYLARGGEGVYTHEDRMSCCAQSAEAGETFIVADSLTDCKGLTLLHAEAEAVTTRRTAGEDVVTLEGEIIFNATFCEASGMVSCRRKSIPFSQECKAEGAGAGDVVCGGVCLKNLNVVLSGEGEDEVLEAEFTLRADCSCFRTMEITPTVDAFCLENELLPVLQSVQVSRPKGDFTVTDSVEGNVVIDDTLPLADSILAAVGARLNVSNVIPSDGRVTVEGMVGCNVVYYSAEHNSKNTVLAQIPFSISVMSDTDETDVITAAGVVTDVNVKIRRGNEIDVRAAICVMMTPVKQETRMVISELKLGEAKPPREAAVSVHIARKNETVWDVAKALGITPEEVVNQNPDVTMPLAGGERLIAYRQLAKRG